MLVSVGLVMPQILNTSYLWGPQRASVTGRGEEAEAAKQQLLLRV